MQMIIKPSRLRLQGIYFGLSIALMVWNQEMVVAQEKNVSASVVSAATYQRVLDLIFPIDHHNFSDDTKEFSLTLRFISAFDEGASQINITKHFDGKIDIVTYKLPEGGQGIGDQLNTILRQTGRENAEEMAKQIKVLKQTFSDQKGIRQLLLRFSTLRLSPHLNTYQFILDPARFELWYKATSNEVYYSLAVPNLEQDRPSHPLAKWMTDVRRAVLGGSLSKELSPRR